MTQAVHLGAFGVRSVLGLTPQGACAAVRAGVSRVAEHPFLVDPKGEPLRVAVDPRLDPDIHGAARVLELTRAAVDSLAEQIGPRTPIEAPLLLALPEHRPGWGAEEERFVAQGLSERGGVRFAPVRVAARGHAGGLHALEIAAEMVANGTREVCFVVGAESYFQPETIAWLSDNRQLVTGDSRTAFFPGEAACAVALCNNTARREHGLPSLGLVRDTGHGTERNLIKTDNENFGHGLIAALEHALRAVAPSAELISDIYSDINGERYRAEEWGFAVLRWNARFRDPTDYVAPADLWGDIGAASGPAFAMLAAQAWARGYANGSLALLVGGSEAGLRSAVVLERSGKVPG